MVTFQVIYEDYLVESCLSPLSTKIGESGTIYTYMEHFQGVTKSANMKYMNMTLDVGEATPTYKPLWRSLGKFWKCYHSFRRFPFHDSKF